MSITSVDGIVHEGGLIYSNYSIGGCSERSTVDSYKNLSMYSITQSTFYF